eukprot:TRINITY_DN2180_c0_g1::TRINITY_DN2180_c0_g1_i1::g.12764::m.12764 TRINITY_DN2180_c0_g1::TRINITY_DN2180_c0_g1_i1::g.12764  ORF type:complete len:178 (+),score=31.48,sp/Q9LMN8/WAK3_ARATH/36.26/2e-08,EGF_CA/PF07645.10/1.2e+03,EGF_CA/PF07645.10/1.8e-08,EGF_3/PF12947.2/2.2e+03,EGF_3/PF12947.2/3.8e-08,EGF/PF00008.22/0.00019,EGF/PF00008.22/1e+03,cEGF/PF12662.2/0.21,cEGF/PF12662.2/0.14,EGF_MSP1_1/PF12946.2/9.4e+02,EGF_MSP1_1/PF12946.2/0.03,Cons_hypoth698/PF03601.9/0.044,FXa_inhibition/PF14670.1/1.2e+03,FX
MLFDSTPLLPTTAPKEDAIYKKSRNYLWYIAAGLAICGLAAVASIAVMNANSGSGSDSSSDGSSSQAHQTKRESSCEDGYYSTAEGCVDFDECAEGMASCSTEAYCTNYDGGYTCTCNSGYDGNGYTCTLANEYGISRGPPLSWPPETFVMASTPVLARP